MYSHIYFCRLVTNKRFVYFVVTAIFFYKTTLTKRRIDIVVVNRFGSFWIVLDRFESFWIVWDRFVSFGIVLDHFGSF